LLVHAAARGERAKQTRDVDWDEAEEQLDEDAIVDTAELGAVLVAGALFIGVGTAFKRSRRGADCNGGSDGGDQDLGDVHFGERVGAGG
jgi:hypothetical protein